MDFFVENAIKSGNDVKWAVAQMNEDKKVRRKSWDKRAYMYVLDRKFMMQYVSGLKQEDLDYDKVNATDWEIYEEEDNWNLADNNFNRDLFAKTEIKTFIQKVKEDIEHILGPGTFAVVDKIIDKRAGNL